MPSAIILSLVVSFHLIMSVAQVWNMLARGGAVEARRAHNPKVVGSNPTPATKDCQGTDILICVFLI